jgi:peptide/histidine transporter 3/4
LRKFVYSFSLISAIGVGAVHSNIAIFGAEQIREQKATTQYFDKYYVAVNTGCLLAFGIIAFIQQNESYYLGYLISTIILALTSIFFLLGYRFYAHTKPHDSALTNFFFVLVNAYQTRRKHKRQAHGMTTKRKSNEPVVADDQEENNNHSSFSMSEGSMSFFDYARVANNGGFQDRIVDEIISLRRVILVFLLLIPYWLIYFQVKSFFLL